MTLTAWAKALPVDRADAAPALGVCGAVLAFPPAIRKMIYTTNAVESLMIKTRGSFPSDEAALKLLYMAIQHAGLRWKPAIVRRRSCSL